VPLIDVKIVLMLFFMSISRGGQPTHEPPPSKGVPEVAIMTVDLLESGRVRHVGGECSVEAFANQLSGTTAGGLVVVVHDGTTPHQLQRLQQLRTLALKAGMRFSWDLASR
jgi:hypothetical protein